MTDDNKSVKALKLQAIEPELLLTKEERQEKAGLMILNNDPEYEAYLARIPAKKKERAHRQQAQTRHGLHAIAPTTCLGPGSCTFIHHCPIPERDLATGKLNVGPNSDYPMYQSCLYERLYMQTKISDYLVYLDVDPENPIEIAQVNELAVIDLYKNRALLILSEGDMRGEGRDFLQVDVTGHNEHGSEETSTKLHPAADMLERLEKRRERVINQLGESRKRRQDLELKIGGVRQDNQVLAELRAVREALMKAHELPAAPSEGLLGSIKLDD